MPRRYWRRGWWQKLVSVAVISVLIVTGVMYGIAEWYLHSEQSQPFRLGVTFVPDYASYLGVDPQQTMDGLINIGVRNFRLTSYWNEGEPTPGHYDFSQLDWQFAKADAAHAKVTLTVGLRQPRWPECHVPSWVNTASPESQWYPQLKAYMTAVINRYKDNPALGSYQLENEYFLKQFGFYGACHDFSRARLSDEFNALKRLDPQHPVIIGRSNNDLGVPLGQPQPDLFSDSIYMRVWDTTFHTHRYLEYPFPSWYFGFMAGSQKLLTGKDMVIGELQAEPWPPHGQSILNTPLAEQDKSFNAQRLTSTVQFAKNTGIRTAYLWGAEYWYYRAQILHDPSVWNAARQAFSQAR